MFASNNLFALISAYNLTMPPAKSLDEFRSQSQEFIFTIKPFVDELSALFRKKGKVSLKEQFQFDAFLSVAFDAGLELFFDSRLPGILNKPCGKRTILEAFTSVPEWEGTLRPALAKQMSLYRMPPLSRREIEMQLYIGAPTFAIGRCKDPSDPKSIVYAPSVMHPIIQFLCRSK